MATKTTDAPLSEDERQAIRNLSEAAAAALGIANDTPDAIQGKIQDMADGIAMGTIENPLGDDAHIALGALWGNTLCETYGWEWIVPIHGDWRGLGVADRERTYLALPLDLFRRIINEKDDETPGPYVRWKAIGISNLPASSPGMYTIITS
ncbi:MAG TPA: hypothetical protein VGJ26_00310 [Pirellulales bacterium]|jgi:hypothetical protein